MSRKVWIPLLLSFALLFALATSAYAFSDIKGDPAEREILELRDRGVISGVDDQTFAPSAKLNYAAAIHLIVKGLGLNINAFLTNKELKASQFFTKIPDDAWYAKSFIIAQMNGLPIAKDADPNQPMTREQFADLLFKGMMTQGDFAFIDLWVNIQDEKDVNPAFMESIQKLVVSKMTALEDGKFYPKRIITRSETAKMLYNAIRFVEDQQKRNVPAPQQVDPTVTMSTEKVNDQINKVTLSWGEKPNPGYRIVIRKTEFFEESGEAHIYYQLLNPEPDKAYAAVISYPKAETFLASSYKPSAKNIDDAAAAGHPATQTLTYGIEGVAGTEEANYYEGQNGYFLYVPTRMAAEKEAAGKDLFVTNEIPRSSMRVEVLDSGADIERQKTIAKEELKLLYPGREPAAAPPQGDPIFGKAYHQIGSFDDKTATTIHLMPIDGKNFKITVQVWKSETWAIPVFNAMIQSIGAVQK